MHHRELPERLRECAGDGVPHRPGRTNPGVLQVLEGRIQPRKLYGLPTPPPPSVHSSSSARPRGWRRLGAERIPHTDPPMGGAVEAPACVWEEVTMVAALLVISASQMMGPQTPTYARSSASACCRERTPAGCVGISQSLSWRVTHFSSAGTWDSLSLQSAPGRDRTSTLSRQ